MRFIKAYVGKKIKEAVNAAGITQAEFAEKMDVSTSTVSQWVRGVCLPEDSREDSLLTILGINKDYFFNANPAPNITLTQIEEIRRAIEGKTNTELLDRVYSLEDEISIKNEEIRKLKEKIHQFYKNKEIKGPEMS